MSRQALRTGVVGTALVLLGGAGPADGYRFLARGVTSSNEVSFWAPSDFPLRFRMMENDLLPGDVGLDAARWRNIVLQGFGHWTSLATARIELELDDASVRLPRADADDGLNTVGFSTVYVGNEDIPDWVTAGAWLRYDDDRLVGCDIQVNPHFVKNWAPQDPYRLLEVVVTHEMGHCLGLGHTEPHPMPLWTDLPVHADPAFLPDPVMSYSNSYGLDLPEDDTAAVSLLYPAPGFFESRGAVRGSVSIEEHPATFAYVQAVRPGEDGVPARPGPGTFADESGAFHLEGLSPGHWMLWVHPMLVTRRNAHGRMLVDADEAGASDFLDQLRWVRVQAGEVLEDVEIVVQPGREVTR